MNFYVQFIQVLFTPYQREAEHIFETRSQVKLFS